SATSPGSVRRPWQWGISTATASPTWLSPTTTSNDVSILLNDGAWPGPIPPPGGGSRMSGGVPRLRTRPASSAVFAEALTWVDPGVAGTARPSASALPGDGSRPLLGEVEPSWIEAAGATFRALQPPVVPPILTRARAEGTARWLADRPFAESESGWPSSDD